MNKIKVAVLGATGMIGQRFVQLLEDHPYFELAGLYASERSEGKRLRDTLKVRDHEFSDESLESRISAIDVKEIARSARVAFSGLRPTSPGTSRPSWRTPGWPSSRTPPTTA